MKSLIAWAGLAFALIPMGTARGEAEPPAPSAAELAWRQSKRCGVNCLYVLLRSHGIEVAYDRLVDEVAIGDKGTTLAELSRVARAHGINLLPMRATRESIRDWALPAVLHLERQNFERHYVLLLRVESEEYTILDCTTGQMSIWGEGEFRDKWSGYVGLIRSDRNDIFVGWLPYAWLAAGAVVFGLGLRGRRRFRLRTQASVHLPEGNRSRPMD